jgi:hypothetical protein
MSKPSWLQFGAGDDAERGHDRAQRTIVHVEDAPPRHAPHVDAERVAPIDVIVEHRRQQIVGRRNGVEVAGEVQIDVLHRHHLGVTAAGGTALHAERGPQRGLAQAQHRLLADVIERVGQAHGRRGLALARRRRRDRRDENELAVRPPLQRLDEVHRQLGLVMAVGLEVLRRDAEPLARDIEDRPLGGGLRDFNVGLRRLVLRSRHVWYP